MSTARQLLAELDDLGVTVELEEPDTLAFGPADRLPDALIPRLKAAKPELLTLVAARAAVLPDLVPTAVLPAPPTDPRRDLADDSADWRRLLALAEAIPPALAGTLHGIRCCGARLVYDRRWRLEPTIDPTERIGLWQDRAAWERDRDRWLKPYRSELVELLGKLPPPSKSRVSTGRPQASPRVGADKLHWPDELTHKESDPA